MSDEMPARRLEDIQAVVALAVTQAMTPFRLTLERLDTDVQNMKSTLYGNPVYKQVGVVDRLDKIETNISALGQKIDQLIDASQARDNQFIGAKKAFYALAAVVAVLGGPPAVVALLRAFGVSP